MTKEVGIIQTGVDKLVELVRAKKRISVQEAAKLLGVGPIVVEEWADFLEEEGIISIEYKFATPYLVEKKLSIEEIKEKEKEFHGKKEGFIRKAEVALVILDRESEDFQKFKNSFEQMKKELDAGLQSVEDELHKLEKVEKLKNGIDCQIAEQQKELQKKMLSFESEIDREQKKYMEVADKINLEIGRLDRERLDAFSLREREVNIRKKIDQFENNILKINDAIKAGEIEIEDSEKRIKGLRNIAENVRREIEKKDMAKDLIRESNLHQQRILALQREIMKKVSRNKGKIDKRISEGKNSTKKFRDFFNKKLEIEKVIKEMDKLKDELENQLIELIKKAKVLHLSSKSSSLKTDIKEIEDKFEDIKKKKGIFEREAMKLASLFRS